MCSPQERSNQQDPLFPEIGKTVRDCWENKISVICISVGQNEDQRAGDRKANFISVKGRPSVSEAPPPETVCRGESSGRGVQADAMHYLSGLLEVRGFPE